MKGEKTIRKSKKELDSIIKTIPDIIYRLDGDGYVTFISNSIREYGYEPEELLGVCLVDLVHPEDKCRALYRINERRTGKRRTELFDIRLVIKRRKEASSELFNVSAEGLYSTKKPNKRSFLGTQGIIRNITYIRQLQKEQLYREKLEGALEMAGAVCHELTQPMQSISGYSELLLMELAVDNPIYSKIDRINQQISRMGEITRKLMSISRYETKEYIKGQKIIDIDKSTSMLN